MKKDLFEIGATQSSKQMDDHKAMIQKFVDNGYTIESQEESKEEGYDQELISTTFETVLKPPSSELPFMKLQAKEVFGSYSTEDGSFEAYENSKFELKAFRKGSGLHQTNDPWDQFDLG